MRFMKIILVLSACGFILCGCAAFQEQGQHADYEETKKMLVDLLKTDEGKKAIQDILSEEETIEKIVIDQPTVKETVEKTLTSEKGKSFWQETMKDPEYQKKFAESMQAENEKLLKNLMKDPEYQGMLIDVLKDPELEKTMLDLFKSKEYREQVMTIMTEAFESPHFKAKISELLENVAKKQMEKEEDGGKEEGEQGEQGGDQGNQQDQGGGSS